MLTAIKNNFAELAQRNQQRKSAKHTGLRAIVLKAHESKATKLITLFAFAMAAMVIGEAAHAFTTPAAGSFGYNIYDIAVNKVAKGPIGFVGGGWLIATAATKMNEGWVRALPYAIGGSCLIKVDELTTSLGALIH